jgi:magnesium-transporting ATPase (P-type)
MNADGLRVVGVATRRLPAGQDTCSVADEAGLTLAGYVAFLDPPKESAAPALAALRANGVTVKVLTGDNGLVSARVCREVGLEVGGMLQGADIAGMDEPWAAVESTTVFAKLSPIDKERVVRALRGNGHVVGFMGDGINDAPALHAADIGISVDTAVDIAKEAADIILLEKSLMVLVDGVREGRKTFANMLKYIRMTASSNFGNVFSVLVASVFLPFLPMLPCTCWCRTCSMTSPRAASPSTTWTRSCCARPSTGTWTAWGASWCASARSARSSTGHLRADVVRLPRHHAGRADAVPVGLVRRGAAVTDADRAHHPHPQAALPGKPRPRCRLPP